jgi:hypothetical protein
MRAFSFSVLYAHSESTAQNYRLSVLSSVFVCLSLSLAFTVYLFSLPYRGEFLVHAGFTLILLAVAYNQIVLFYLAVVCVFSSNKYVCVLSCVSWRHIRYVCLRYAQRYCCPFHIFSYTGRFVSCVFLFLFSFSQPISFPTNPLLSVSLSNPVSLLIFTSLPARCRQVHAPLLSVASCVHLIYIYTF